jgi:histone acetyltransferase (RNA polymerase elongator complex component)
VDGIRLSTRPDTIDPARLEHIMAFPITTVELGVQSMDDAVLAVSNRGHSSHDTVRAHSILKEFGLKTGLQMMVGLPGDDGSSSVYTAEKLVDLNPDYIRIYPTIVLKGSLLSKWFKSGTYKPLELEESVTLVKHLYYIFKRKNIRVIRMGLQASEDLNQGAEIIAGPYHPSFGHLVLSSVFYDMARHELTKKPDTSRHVVINVHPRNISRLQGLNKTNIPALKKEFHLASLDIKGDNSLSDDCLSVNPAG